MNKECISEETLADFLEGRLAADKQGEVEGHLADCDQCLDIIKMSVGFIRGEVTVNTQPVPDDITKAAMDLIGGQHQEQAPSTVEKVGSSFKQMSARVSRWFSHEFWNSPNLAPVRGDWQIVSENVIQVRKQFKSFEIEIEIEKINNDTATIRVTLVSGAKAHTGMRVTLKKEEREVSSETMKGSLVVFESIPFGRYCLVFTRMGGPLGHYKFEIKESANES